MATATSSQTSRARSGPLRSTFDAHGGAGRWASGWFMSFVAAWVHILVVNVAAATLGGFAWVVVYAAMPAATAFFVPESRSGLWRWLVLLILAGITSLDFALVVLVAGECVLVHRFWVAQRRFGFIWAPAPVHSKEAGRGRRR